MPIFDLPGNRYLGSEYSAAEVRVLFELYENEGCKAAYISKKMNIDKSYLSRILKTHEKNGYVLRRVSQADARSNDLYLTERGRHATEDLIQKSNEQITEIIRPLQQEDREKLHRALSDVIDILGKRPGGQANENRTL